jgi:hypothetical protein
VFNCWQEKKSGNHPMNQKLTIVGHSDICVDMSKQLPPGKHARSAGISLEPELIKKATALAKARGLRTLSAFARQVFTVELQNATEKLEQTAEKKKKSGLGKVKKAVGQVSDSADDTHFSTT